jgi:predicted phosphodiesterase
MRWVAQQLTDEDERQIAEWPATLMLAAPGHGDVLFCHASPRNDTDIFTRATSDDRLAPLFEGIRASVVVCGHTHMQFDRTHAGVRVLNAGSVGMPFGAPGAYWLLIGDGEIEFRRTDYDLAAAADDVRQRAYPQAEHFASQSILRPPSEAAMLEAFSR